jgi:chemotaxis signal transduction protein
LNHHTDLLAELRAAFVRGFADAPAPDAPTEDLLAVRVGTAPCALPLADLRGLHHRRPIVALPGGPPGFLGIVAIRGRVVPAFDLATLVGAPAGGPAEWLAIAATEPPVGLAFAAYDGFLRLPRDADAEAGAGPRVVHVGDVARDVVHLPDVLRALARPMIAGSPRKEP